VAGGSPVLPADAVDELVGEADGLGEPVAAAGRKDGPSYSPTRLVLARALEGKSRETSMWQGQV